MQRFYGGRPSEWWTMPVVELNAYSAMLPVLEADESIRRSNEIGVGTGSMDKDDSKRILGRWSRAANARSPQLNRIKATPGSLPPVGIGGG